MLRKQNFADRKQENVLPQVDKNNFASLTHILLPKHMFPSLAAMKAMLTSFQSCLLKVFPRNKVTLLFCACVALDHRPKQCFLV